MCTTKMSGLVAPPLFNHLKEKEVDLVRIKLFVKFLYILDYLTGVREINVDRTAFKSYVVYSENRIK